MNTLASIFFILLNILFYLCIISLIFSAIKAIRSKKYKLAWPPLSIILSAVILGAVITGLYTGQEKFVQDSNCGVAFSQDIQSEAPANLNIICTNLAYGFPRKFISGQANVTTIGQPTNYNVALKNAEIGSTISLSAKSLAFDLAVWSTVSFVFLSAVYTWRKSPTKSSKKKK